MRHPTDGTLRRLVDEPDGVADTDREHVAGCPVCLAALATANRDAAAAEAALHLDAAAPQSEAGAHLDAAPRSEAGAHLDAAPRSEAALHLGAALDVDAAWNRLSRAVTDRSAGRAATATSTRRWRTTLRSPVTAVVAVVALLAGASAAAATNWLPIFRTERIAPVSAPEVDLAKLPDLDAFGDLKVTEKVNIHKVSDAAAAQKETGISLPQLSSLPRGVTGEPAFLANGRVSAEFTFSADKAAQFVRAAGGTPPAPPAGLDGSQFRLVAGPGVAMVWAEGRPRPAMMVARAKAPTVFSSGIPFETARDYLLSLPGLPASVASQLKTFSADGTTLPLLMPADETTTAQADVAGVQATVLTLKDGLGAAVVWVDGGFVTAVAGSLTADEVLSVARGLRWGR